MYPTREDLYIGEIINSDPVLPEELRHKSFIKEVVIQPIQLNKDIKSSSPISIEKLKEISISNFYGGMYFTVLDSELDGDSLWQNLKVKESKEYLKEKYLGSLNKLDKKYRWGDWLERMIKFQDPDFAINETNILIRSEPLFKGFLCVSRTREKQKLKALESYILAKQYHDDLHDFAEDLKETRTSLVTSLLHSTSDPYEQAFHEIFPSVINKIQEYVDFSAALLPHLNALNQLKIGLKRYKEKLSTL